ncbi:hypothetical protein HPB47_019459 [Ixodes persulcatus]|uniref:Uncharacterized protein n=1 Tax=Ixodes persulcatus TaxID=34615 RepID=A0AC60QKC7_IXOPE|nr:hypothetical protein HPB47_019459 [Ixodes persulcatus]
MRRDKFVPNKHSVLCSEHFVVGAYDDKVRLMNEMGMNVKTARLKRDAVPSIFRHKRQAPQRIQGAYAKRRRNEVVSELLSAPSAPPISSTAGADFTRSVTETLNCIEAVCEENEEPQCLDLSVPRAHQQDDEHHGPQVDTYDKGTQVLVRPRMTSRSTQTKAAVKSVGAETDRRRDETTNFMQEMVYFSCEQGDGFQCQSCVRHIGRKSVRKSDSTGLLPGQSQIYYKSHGLGR